MEKIQSLCPSWKTKAGWNAATVFADKSKHPTDLHSRLQRTQGPGWAADRWLCCLGCLLPWLTKFWRGLAQWRGCRSPAGLYGNGSRLWSCSADRPQWHRPPQCPRFDIPCLLTWGCALSVPSGHQLQKAAEKAKRSIHEIRTKHDWFHKNQEKKKPTKKSIMDKLRNADF